MEIKRLIALSANVSGILYLLYVIGYTEQERKKLEKDAKAYKALRVKHKALVRTFEVAFKHLSSEDRRKVMEFANVEMTFAQMTAQLD